MIRSIIFIFHPIEGEKLPNILQKAIVPVIPQAKCKQIYQFVNKVSDGKNRLSYDNQMKLIVRRNSSDDYLTIRLKLDQNVN